MIIGNDEVCIGAGGHLDLTEGCNLTFAANDIARKALSAIVACASTSGKQTISSMINPFPRGPDRGGDYCAALQPQAARRRAESRIGRSFATMLPCCKFYALSRLRIGVREFLLVEFFHGEVIQDVNDGCCSGTLGGDDEGRTFRHSRLVARHRVRVVRFLPLRIARRHHRRAILLAPIRRRPATSSRCSPLPPASWCARSARWCSAASATSSAANTPSSSPS